MKELNNLIDKVKEKDKYTWCRGICALWEIAYRHFHEELEDWSTADIITKYYCNSKYLYWIKKYNNEVGYSEFSISLFCNHDPRLIALQ